MLGGNIRKCGVVAQNQKISHSNRGSVIFSCWTVELLGCRKHILFA